VLSVGPLPPAGRVPSGPPGVARTQLGAASIAAAGVAVIAVVNPVSTHVPLCPFHAMTGLDCPFCGTLRAVFELTRGNIVAGWHDNCLFVACLPLIVALWLDGIWRRSAGRPARRWALAAKVVVVVLALGFAVLRNLPGFSALRPRA
jgi:hypothetical protein